MPTISVIVPVYRAEAFLAACIDSILAQTFPDFELILVNDGSPDGSGVICREYAQKDGRIRYLEQENQGQAAARNYGLSLSTGEWICFVDSDDVIHPQMLEILYQGAITHKAPISMCRYVEGPEMPSDFLRERTAAFAELSMEENSLTRLYDREEYPGWVACTKLVRREIVEGYPFTPGRVFEDNEAVSRWIYQAKVLASTEEELYYYRTNGDSTTKSQFGLKKLDYLWALESITAFWGSCGYKTMKQRFGQRYIDAAIQSCYGARYDLNRPDVAVQTGKRAKSYLRSQKIRLDQEQFEGLLDACHPEWMRFYWPLGNGWRLLKQGGVKAVVRKLSGKPGKGE